VMCMVVRIDDNGNIPAAEARDGGQATVTF
jgi:hypothetical protein